MQLCTFMPRLVLLSNETFTQGLFSRPLQKGSQSISEPAHPNAANQKAEKYQEFLFQVAIFSDKSIDKQALKCYRSRGE